jgi:hypothetical protein
MLLQQSSHGIPVSACRSLHGNHGRAVTAEQSRLGRQAMAVKASAVKAYPSPRRYLSGRAGRVGAADAPLPEARAGRHGVCRTVGELGGLPGAGRLCRSSGRGRHRRPPASVANPRMAATCAAWRLLPVPGQAGHNGKRKHSYQRFTRIEEHRRWPIPCTPSAISNCSID